MNVLIITTHLNEGGISRYVISLAKGLRRHSHTVWVASSGGEWIQQLAAIGADHIYLPIKTKSICSPKVILSFLRLKKFLRSNHVDIIHANTRVTQMLGYLVYKYLGTSYLSAFHGFYRDSLFRKTFHLSGVRSIAVSNSVKKHLIEDLKIDSEKIHVVYNGLDPQEFRPQASRRQEWGFKNSDILAGMLGRISEEKGHFLAVEAIKRLSLKYDNLYLVVSGKGRLQEVLAMFIKKMNMEQRVKIVSSGANEFLDTIDVLLVPSQKEGFGYAIIEAFIKGVPVVGYNSSAIAEIIKSKTNGILFTHYAPFSLADALDEIISKQSLRERITASAREEATKFSLDAMAVDTEKVYWKILGKSFPS
jgi:glycosyltransferase involved in cell wall biosynthesis